MKKIKRIIMTRQETKKYYKFIFVLIFDVAKIITILTILLFLVLLFMGG